MKLVLLSMGILSFSLILLSKFGHSDVFAISPSFVHQEIENSLGNWILIKPSEEILKRHPEWSAANNLSECKLVNGSFPSPDISAVLYISNGKILNATIWLSGMFKGPYLINSSLSRDAIIRHSQTYKMIIDIDSVYHTGTAYAVYIAKNGSSNEGGEGGWLRVLNERSITGAESAIQQPINNYSGFYGNDITTGKGYVKLSLDLGALNYPNQFRILFSLVDTFVKDNRMCRLEDISNWVLVPPPQFNLTSSPSSLILRPGDEKDMELHLNSNANFGSQIDTNASFSINQTDGLRVNFFPDKIHVPAIGEAVTDVKVKALENASTQSSFILPVLAKLSFKSTVKSRISNDIYTNANVTNIPQYSHLAISVLPPEYNISVSPSSLILRPGDQKDIEIKIKSDTNLNSHVLLSTQQDQFNPLEVTLTPNETNIVPLGFATSTLRIKAPENATARPHTISILANTSIQRSGADIKNMQRKAVLGEGQTSE